MGLSAHAAPREIEFKDKLPKTRSGKIMRRVLKAWELDLPTGRLFHNGRLIIRCMQYTRKLLQKY